MQALLAKALEHLKKAVELDNEEDYYEAFTNYTSGIQYLYTCMKNESKERSRDLMKKKLIEYTERAEVIKEFLQKKDLESDIMTESLYTTKKRKELEEKLDSKNTLREFLVDNPSHKIEDIIGNTKVKDKLQESLILPIRFPQMFESLHKPQNFLFYGPPGTGKTMVAKTLGNQTSYKLCYLHYSDVMSYRQDSPEKVIKLLFEKMLRDSPCILCIDDIDAFCNREDERECNRRVLTELLIQLESAKKYSLHFIGITSCPWLLSPSIIRRTKPIYFDLPSTEDRVLLLKKMLETTQLTAEQFNDLASLTDNFSHADISCLCKEIQMSIIRRLSQCTSWKKVDKDGVMFYEACEASNADLNGIKLLDLNTSNVVVPEPTFEDAMAILSNTKPSIPESLLLKFVQWNIDHNP